MEIALCWGATWPWLQCLNILSTALVLTTSFFRVLSWGSALRGQPVIAKRTYTDTALGVARRPDWTTGRELSCFGVRRCVPGCTTFCVCAQFRSVLSHVDKPELRVYVTRVSAEAPLKSAFIPERAAARRSCHAVAVSCAVYSLMQGEKVVDMFSWSARLHGYRPCSVVELQRKRAFFSSLSGLWIMFSRDCKLVRSPYCALWNSRESCQSYDICCAQSLHGAACSRLWSKPKWLHGAGHGELRAPLIRYIHCVLFTLTNPLCCPTALGSSGASLLLNFNITSVAIARLIARVPSFPVFLVVPNGSCPAGASLLLLLPNFFSGSHRPLCTHLDVIIET